MTAEQRFERELPEILADLYPVSAPDYRNDLVQRIAATRQRPAWALPERWIPMTALAIGRSVRPVPLRTIGIVALLLLSIVAVAIIAGSPRRLPPPFGPAANGNLVVAEAGDIFLIDAATGAKTLAIGGPAEDTEPIFSRDGSHIAFFRRADRVNGLWLADDRGDAVRQLSTSSLFEFSQIEWSPDGKSILLTTSEDGQRAPAIVPTDGSAEHILALDMPIEGPVWLPSGEILFRGLPQSGAGLFAIRPDGSDPRTIVAPTGALQWDVQFYAPSPDGGKIAYQWRPTPEAPMVLYVIPAKGGTTQEISTVESANPIWSPDGTWIAFSSDDGMYVVPADGTAPERRVALMKGAFRWAPDSSRLLFFGEDEPAPVLIDPLGGPDETVRWTATEFPDWQRLAPTP
jgi:Tol biopolymer transport system component